jgi:ATP-dependent helicase HrpB
MFSPDLFPVDAVLPELVSALQHGSNVVLKAPTGAGKTTRVPTALLAVDQPGWILVLEPRRLAAQTSARWMAAELRQPVGRTIGYHIRFDRQASRDTRVLIVTEGVFLRMLLDDPLLERVAVVVLDEFHERSLNSDLALALTRRIQTQFRPDLKLVVMSATFDPRGIAEFLNCPVVTCEGRLFPVDIRYLRYPSQRPVHVETASGIESIVSSTSGDVLVFLPGVGEIRRTKEELGRLADQHELDVLELYGDLPADRQDEALRPRHRRKVILATNVAETSVTIPGITAVVDSGFARILRSDPSVGLNRLELTRISRAAADQRAGRAGRTEPGVCLRLWSADEWGRFRDQEVPEVSRIDLTAAVLQLHAWGESEIRGFPWFQPPPMSKKLGRPRPSCGKRRGSNGTGWHPSWSMRRWKWSSTSSASGSWPINARGTRICCWRKRRPTHPTPRKSPSCCSNTRSAA